MENHWYKGHREKRRYTPVSVCCLLLVHRDYRYAINGLRLAEAKVSATAMATLTRKERANIPIFFFILHPSQFHVDSPLFFFLSIVSSPKSRDSPSPRSYNPSIYWRLRVMIHNFHWYKRKIFFYIAIFKPNVWSCYFPYLQFFFFYL